MSQRAKTIIVILLLLFITPLGIILMWFWTRWPLWVKLLVSIPLLLPFLLIFTYLHIAQPYQVTGNAMRPDFENGQQIVVKKLSFDSNPLKRGGVIVFIPPHSKTNTFVKRVVGLPSEKIKLQDGKVYIDGEVISESYIPSGTSTAAGLFISEGQEVMIPDDHYFVLGDNRSASSDSREFGFVPKEDIIGRFWFKY